MFGLGLQELLIIGAVVIFFFGAKRLPLLGGSVGKALKNFKDEVSSKDTKDIDDDSES